MRRATLLGTVILCVALTACDDVLTSVKLDPIQDDRLVGTWVDTDDPDDAGVIEKSGDGYTMRSDKPDAEKTKFTLARAGDTEFAQVEDKCSDHMFALPGDASTCYRIVRLEFGVDSFAFYQINLDKFRDGRNRSVQHRIGTGYLPYQDKKSGGSISCALIDAAPAALAEFLATYPKDAYGEGTSIRRK
jgi:hypothetical protein